MTVAGNAWRVAFNRFGLGARPGSRSLIADPRQALLNELATPGGARLQDPELAGSPQILQAVYADQLRRKMERERVEAGRVAALGMPAPNVAALLTPDPAPAATPIAVMAGAAAMTPGAAAKDFEKPADRENFCAHAGGRP